MNEIEPVAWMFTDSGGTHFTDCKRDWYDAAGIEDVTPLYSQAALNAAIAEELERMADDIENYDGSRAYGPDALRDRAKEYRAKDAGAEG